MRVAMPSLNPFFFLWASFTESPIKNAVLKYTPDMDTLCLRVGDLNQPGDIKVHTDIDLKLKLAMLNVDFTAPHLRCA